jgi:hypothetical protein
MKGFDPIWCEWIKRFVEKGSVGIKVNEDIGLSFLDSVRLSRKNK